MSQPKNRFVLRYLASQIPRLKRGGEKIFRLLLQVYR